MWRKEGQEPQVVPLKLRAYAAFEKNGRAGGDSNRDKEMLHGNDRVGTESPRELVQIVPLIAYTNHKTNQENPTQGWFCDWLP